MNNLDTYNRVSHLESPVIRLLFMTMYILLPIVFIVGNISMGLSGISKKYVIHSVIVSMTVLIIVLGCDYLRTRCCQYCGRTLSRITRPLILKQKYLSMRGLKQGDYFYTRRAEAKKWFGSHWVKISNYSLACHHCRLTEKKHREFFENVSASELQAVQQNREI